MKLLDKYSQEFEHLNNPALRPMLEGIDVVNPGEDNITTVDPKKTIFVGEKVDPHKIISAFQKYQVEHFVQVDTEGFIYDLLAASIMLRKPEAFMKNPLPFFMNHFKQDGENKNKVRSKAITFSSSKDKSTILTQLTDFLGENSKTANFIEAVHMIADELLMNAIYNAPVDPSGKPLFMNTDRAKPVVYPSGKKGGIFITHDERRLLIGCQDPFGSVSRYKLVQQLAKVLDPKHLAAPNETAGAGLGTKMMIENSCGYFMIVRKNKQSLVCCALPLGVSYRKAEQMSKNIHMVFF